jgi:hypothetical protein
MKTRQILLLILCVTVLTACPRDVVRKSSNLLQKTTIKLHVTEDSTKLIVNSLGSGRCKATTPSNGCIAVNLLDTALISFELKTSPDWHFTKFIICPGDVKEKVCNLEKWQQVEFFAADSKASKTLFPDANGIIDLTQLSPDLTEFYLFDYNSAEQDFFYSIEVCNTDKDPETDKDPKCLWTDPEIDNKGRR